ncbi:glutamic acid-rich protein-like [Momordica charantia]|uniref:Glutamic acid-rich protein-like n=1 Tax=Momordica charantia TaxID=3673 RepID=A0A6J1DVH0_MOMCH|nr:glutamic acid-rich protein-like [Momordica charantia]
MEEENLEEEEEEPEEAEELEEEEEEDPSEVESLDDWEYECYEDPQYTKPHSPSNVNTMSKEELVVTVIRLKEEVHQRTREYAKEKVARRGAVAVVCQCLDNMSLECKWSRADLSLLGVEAPGEDQVHDDGDGAEETREEGP